MRFSRDRVRTDWGETTMTHLLIFDLDGTLLDGHGAGHQAMEAAFLAVLGAPGHFDQFDFEGRTDPAIFQWVAQRQGLGELTPEVLRAVEQRFLMELEHTEKPVVAKPGVRALLMRLAADKTVALAIGTGNLEIGARIKLTRAGLDYFFPVGGYGSDGIEREAVIAKAMERSRVFYDVPNAPVITIGDTPRDVAAAHANGVFCIGVATGSFSQAELAGAGADAVLADLTQPEQFGQAVYRLTAR